MAQGMIRGATAPDEFARLHRLFVEHYAIGLGFVWASALVAAGHAPWVRNIRGLIDPAGRPESTLSFLFGLPVLLTLGWVCVLLGADLMRRSTVLKRQAVEFGLAGAVAFAVFCLAIHRAVTAFLLGF